MRTPTASDVLRRHARERYIRAGIRSACLDGDLVTAERMSQAAFVESCALVRGVPEVLLTILGHYFCESAGWSWREVLVEVQGEQCEVRVERATIPLTLAQAARRAGYDLGWQELKQMRAQAIARITDNVIARAGRGEEVAA